ncbi:MAG: hypothetical protein CVV33_01480 [Methanomicrobiales archaeon HGW-Methanomicrobiales-4]|nr:MAG: hypothetical protein CVV33_01480 [Methanomicrobiales archaeon HGW-Methanomicrobiales-4]
MVLEEEIYFSTQDIAKEFVKMLKEQGVSSLIRQKSNLDIRLMLSGTYTNLIAMLNETIEDEDASEEETEIYTQTQTHLTSQRDLIAEAFEKYQIGDRVGSGVMDIVTGDRTIEGDENEDTLEDIIEEIYLTRLLHLNDLIEIGESGFTLAKTIEPDQATLTIFADELPMIEDEMLAKYTITSTITVGDDEEWMVTIGSELVFLEDLTPVEEFLEEYEIPEEEGTIFFPKIQMKQLIVSKILAMIREGGKASRDDIIGELAEQDIETKESGSLISLNLSKSYIDAVLDDLKKAGILKGKDQKLRIAL